MTHAIRMPSLFQRAALMMTIALLCAAALSACGAAALPIVPTAQPTATASSTPAPTRTPGRDATPSPLPTSLPMTPTGGPSPTPLFGQPATAVANVSGSSVTNPNAPRIEFFTTDVLSIAPGDSVTLYWSTRNTTSANIYRLERGVRNQLYRVEPDGSLTVTTRRSDRTSVDFLLTVGDGALTTEQVLSIPILCPDAWFFQPPPSDCPAGPARETQIIEQSFERGRMVYVVETNLIYALINDGFAPAWIVVENRFNPATDLESEPSFVPPQGFYQPVRQLGFVWRGNDTIRGRLGLAITPDSNFEGFIQSVNSAGGDTTLYIASADASVLQLLPEGDQWQIITAP
ncbi:MAG: hypothetical protein KME04_13650 [Pleurocapsa minor GSE-CHR-MK-17-07R]|nr:hypothetical protein [Pleurocapsa minor GSE-CHR-MK 17-07R]